MELADDNQRSAVTGVRLCDLETSFQFLIYDEILQQKVRKVRA